MTVIYLILALIALGVLVFIHELGHYWAARLVGMRVEIFSIGFGKPLMQWQWSGVKWQLGALPFGGFVKIAGMEISRDRQAADTQEIENGFFSKPPLARMAVVLAGPFANLILALVAFLGLWLAGGRQKAFTEQTHIVGWLDPQSQLWELGLHPGDSINELNGKSYSGIKDLLHASVFGADKIEIKGFHYENRKPFHYTVEPYFLHADHEFKSSGILAGARYLIYDTVEGQSNPLSANSPMISSGIEYKDRLVWADGHYLFSMESLSHLINENKALLTVQRGSRTFLSRQPRILAGDLSMSGDFRNDLADWSFDAGIHKRWQHLYIVPYVITSDGTVLESLGEMKKTRGESVIEAPLQRGDKIIAVDGVPTGNGHELLSQLQDRRVQLIVSKGVDPNTGQYWNTADQHFFDSMDIKTIDSLAATIGKSDQKQLGAYRMLSGIQPKLLSELSPENKATKDDRYVLGIALQDAQVIYNPTPLFLFKNAVMETLTTLKSLLTGKLNPKWLAGPVGIVQVIHHGWQLGVGEALFWIAIISLNLGIFNLLPIPVLDGGYVVLSLWEMVTGRRVSLKTMERIIIPFVVLLMAMFIFLTFQDIARLFK